MTTTPGDTATVADHVRHRAAPPLRARATLLFVLFAIGGAVGAEPSLQSRDPFLAALAGRWDLVGAVGKTAVHYHGRGEWVLDGGWLRLGLKDVGKPPRYTADLYLSYDPKAGDYIVHWIDQFGAAGARVVATGRRTGRTLVFTFPYAEGSFRDTLTLATGDASGSLLIESQKAHASWSTFASYTLTRRR